MHNSLRNPSSVGNGGSWVDNMPAIKIIVDIWGGSGKKT